MFYFQIKLVFRSTKLYQQSFCNAESSRKNNSMRFANRQIGEWKNISPRNAGRLNWYTPSLLHGTSLRIKT